MKCFHSIIWICSFFFCSCGARAYALRSYVAHQSQALSLIASSLCSGFASLLWCLFLNFAFQNKNAQICPRLFLWTRRVTHQLRSGCSCGIFFENSYVAMVRFSHYATRSSRLSQYFTHLCPKLRSPSKALLGSLVSCLLKNAPREFSRHLIFL